MGVLWVRVGVGVCVGVRVGVRVGARPPHSANGRRDGLSSTSTVTDMVLQGGVRMWRGGGEEYLDGHLDRSGSGGGQNVERGSGEGVDVAAEADAILSRYVDWARSEEGQRPAESVVPRRLYFDLGHPSRAPSGVVRGPKGKLRRVAR